MPQFTQQFFWYPFAVVLLAATTIPGGFTLGATAGILQNSKKHRPLVFLLGLASPFVTYWITHSNGLKLELLDTVVAMALTLPMFFGAAKISARIFHGRRQKSGRR